MRISNDYHIYYSFSEFAMEESSENINAPPKKKIRVNKNVEDLFNCQSCNKRYKLKTNLEKHFSKVHPKPNLSLKTSNELNMSMVIPNELWLKIMTYLKTTDLLKSFNLVCKRFHNLTLDKSAIRDLDIIECKGKINQEKIVKLIKRLTYLKRLEITDSEIYVNQFLYQFWPN